MATALPGINAIAQAQVADCGPAGAAIRRAAEAGKAQANARGTQTEDYVRQQVKTARVCMDTFGDIAARQTMVVGGFNLGPLRDSLMGSACDVAETKARAAAASAVPGGSQVFNAVQSGDPNVLRQVAISQSGNQSIVSASNQASSVYQRDPSLWDKIACKFGSGSC